MALSSKIGICALHMPPFSCVRFCACLAGADEDTRRAMNKSFQESNGTVLSTNWKEIGSKKTECARMPSCIVQSFVPLLGCLVPYVNTNAIVECYSDVDFCCCLAYVAEPCHLLHRYKPPEGADEKKFEM